MEPAINEITPWAPHASAAPKTRRDGDTLIAAANGTRTCAGGWQARFTGIKPGNGYRIEVPVSVSGLEFPRQAEWVRVIVFWGTIKPAEDTPEKLVHYDTLFLSARPGGGYAFIRDIRAPSDATELTVRMSLRWTAKGEVSFGLPRVTPVAAPAARRVRIAVATGSMERRRGARIRTIADNVAYYRRLCEEARAGKPALIVLPEIALQWEVAGNALDLALALDAPEVGAFLECARRANIRILVGFHERDGDAVFNTAALAGPGGIEGVYHKVHLAECGETHSGILPGNGFPVFDTPIGRIGCNICMDSSAAESSRMIGLNGADIMLLPIMGDHRADTFTCGAPAFHEERWKAIMRTRALDNQFCLTVSRNEALGSCIIDHRGDILAYNDGTRDIIAAEVGLDPDWRKWNGGSQRDIVWMQRRPHCYGAFTADEPPVIRKLPGYPGAG
jgi:predicted amidohydrolase